MVTSPVQICTSITEFYLRIYCGVRICFQLCDNYLDCLLCILCRPEEFVERVAGASGSGATPQQTCTTDPSKAEATRPDSDSDSELFVNTNRPPAQAQSDHSSESDSS
jgi:hypothetical protein